MARAFGARQPAWQWVGSIARGADPTCAVAVQRERGVRNSTPRGARRQGLRTAHGAVTTRLPDLAAALHRRSICQPLDSTTRGTRSVGCQSFAESSSSSSSLAPKTAASWAAADIAANIARGGAKVSSAQATTADSTEHTANNLSSGPSLTVGPDGATAIGDIPEPNWMPRIPTRG